MTVFQTEVIGRRGAWKLRKQTTPAFDKTGSWSGTGVFDAGEDIEGEIGSYIVGAEIYDVVLGGATEFNGKILAILEGGGVREIMASDATGRAWIGNFANNALTTNELILFSAEGSSGMLGFWGGGIPIISNIRLAFEGVGSVSGTTSMKCKLIFADFLS